MVLIFAGSIFCRSWVYAHSHFDTIPAQHTAVIKLNVNDSNLSDCAWNRLFKSKRRIEKYGFAQQAFVSPVTVDFYSTITILSLFDIQKPSPAEIFTPPQPPRLLSLV
jgi:hypothetical protein